jgi:hypothetical protein
MPAPGSADEAKRDRSRLVQRALTEGIDWMSLSPSSKRTLRKIGLPMSYGLSLGQAASRVGEEGISEALAARWLDKLTDELEEQLGPAAALLPETAKTPTTCFKCSTPEIVPGHRVCQEHHDAEKCGTCARFRARGARCEIPQMS